MDVKVLFFFFLYGTIEEEVYVNSTTRIFKDWTSNKVYKVVKALYGLHQAPIAWYETLANYLLDNGFQRGKIDQTLFIKKQKGDILLVQKEDRIFISQDKYVAEILKKFNYSDVKSASTPVDLEKPLVKDRDADDVDVHLYRSMIGSLMYLTASRPDIMFACRANCGCTSTTETKYVAAASCCRQVLWIQNQLLDYGYNFMNTVINIDNNNLLTKGFDARRFQYLVSSSGSLVQDTLFRDVDAKLGSVNAVRLLLMLPV
ncbi:retrovirus-related pol polyprotein from transposon TNT 1-94 [Tanacetum coccineum]